MSEKTNVGLVAYAKDLVSKGAVYWYGTYGQIGTEALLKQKSEQYPKMLSAKRVETAIKRGDIGKIVTDCSGVIKGYLMQNKDGELPVYNPYYDHSADGFYSLAEVKGSIDTIPEIPGLGLYKKNHAGVYLGNGKVIEAKGFDYGVVEDTLSDNKWSAWYEIPFVTYVKDDVPDLSPVSPQPVPDPSPADPLPTDETSADTGIYIVQKGDTLSGIAKKFGTKVKVLVELNGIENPDLIIVGQKIKLPTTAAPVEPELVRVGTVNTVKDPLNVRATPNGKVIAQLPKGSKISIIGEEKDGWLKLHERDGYVFAKLVSF